MRIRGYGLYSILPREHSQKWVRLSHFARRSTLVRLLALKCYPRGKSKKVSAAQCFNYGLYPRFKNVSYLVKLVVSKIQNFSVSGRMLGASAIFTKSPQSPETPPPLRVAACTHKISPHVAREGL